MDVSFVVLVLLGSYPARIPAAGSLLTVTVGIVPELIVPYASTEISLLEGTETKLVDGAGAVFTAWMPEPPEWMTVPASVETWMSPVP